MKDLVTCPLCQHSFHGRDACSHCGLVPNCTLLKCPHCGYEFVEKSATVSLLVRVVARLRSFSRRRGRNGERKDGVIPLTHAPLSEPCRVVSMDSQNRSRLNRLAVFGLIPGCEILLRQRSPSYLLRVGETEIAVDREVVKNIYVKQVVPHPRKLFGGDTKGSV